MICAMLGERSADWPIARAPGVAPASQAVRKSWWPRTSSLAAARPRPLPLAGINRASWPKRLSLLACGAGTRPDYPISGHRPLLIRRAQSGQEFGNSSRIVKHKFPDEMPSRWLGTFKLSKRWWRNALPL